LAGRDRVCYNERALRARITLAVLSFFAAFAAAATPVVPAVAVAALERAPTLGGEAERTPAVTSNPSPSQLRAAREASPRPGFWKLPPYALTLRFVATPIPTALARATESAHAPVAPPSAPRSCRGPPRT
jgi:hypothetical protein